MSETSGIYMIQNTKNNKVYIGSSKQFKIRWKQHICMLNSANHHSKHLQYAWNKYGEQYFKFTLIENVDNLDNLFAREQYWMDKYQSYNPKKGYNISQVAGSYVMNEKYDFDEFIQEEIERENKYEIIYTVLDKENKEVVYQYPYDNENLNVKMSDLAFKIYSYYLLIEFDTYTQITLYSKNMSILINDFYNLPVEVGKQIIYNNEIKMIYIKDPETAYETSIYSNNLIEAIVYCQDNNCNIDYDDGFLTKRFIIRKSSNCF